MAQLNCLVPVRNGQKYLGLYLEEAARWFDSVIALDDGSTDTTRSMLESSPVVRHLIKHPVRPSYLGWNDMLNRSKLLQHLDDRQYSGWVLFLDVDELLDSEDAALLRRLAHTDQLDRRHAYGLRVFRMVDDMRHFYKGALMVYRLFYYEPGYTLAGNPLHFVPVPTVYPTETWRPTNLRIRHRCSMTESMRQERYAKYKEVDPDGKFQSSYENLLDPPKRVREWRETAYEDLFRVED